MVTRSTEIQSINCLKIDETFEVGFDADVFSLMNEDLETGDAYIFTAKFLHCPFKSMVHSVCHVIYEISVLSRSKREFRHKPISIYICCHNLSTYTTPQFQIVAREISNLDEAVLNVGILRM